MRGYQEGPSLERAGFGVLSSFASTIAVARGVTHLQERRRAMPGLRSLVRRAWHAPRTGGVRVHHFLPGISLASTAGATVILTRTDGAELRFGVPFGIGMALTLDELALLADVDNAYWRSAGFAIAQAALATAGATALAARFFRRGRREMGHCPE